jgi:hypothetical protein
MFEGMNCTCCPEEGDECNPIYNGQYCDNGQPLVHPDCAGGVADPDPSIPISDPSCDLSNYFQHYVGTCCPLYNPCDEELYPEGFCDDQGEIVFVPDECFGELLQCKECPEGYIDGVPECSCCPQEGKACDTDLYGFAFCVDDTPFIPNHCFYEEPPLPVVCDACPGIYSQSDTTCACCPIQGYECDEMYSGEFCNSDGEIEVPEGCPLPIVEPKPVCAL